MSVLIRTDASPDIGTGHALRSLAIAQAIKGAGEDVSFAMAVVSPRVEQRILDEGIAVHRIGQVPGSARDSADAIRIARSEQVDCLLLDGYHFDEQYELRIRAHAGTLIAIDDAPRRHAAGVDIVLNPNVHAAGMPYPVSRGNRLLLGPRYALLRREFLGWRGWKRPLRDPPRRVLVAFGGADFRKATSLALEALGVLRGRVDVRVLLGPGTASTSQTHVAAQSLGGDVVENSHDVPAAMAWADCAVLTPSTVALEAIFMKLPFVAVVIADNQIPVAEWLERNRVSPVLQPFTGGSWRSLAEAVEQTLTRIPPRPGQVLVDGLGVDRLLAARSSAGLLLDAAQPSDAKLLWEWANDPETRAASFSDSHIPWDSHMDWLNRLLGDSSRHLFVARSVHGEPVGQVRFDVEARTAIMSISVDPARRNRGEGSALIATSANWALQELAIDSIVARIKRTNYPSIRAFESAGFAPTRSAPDLLELTKSR